MERNGKLSVPTDTRYSLVQFIEDDILYITASKNVTPIEGNLVWAPYKSMGYYEANLIATNSRIVLTEMMKQKKRCEGNVKQKNVETSLDKNENISLNVNSAQAKSVDTNSEVMNNSANVNQKNVETSLDENENIAPNVNSAQAKSVDISSEVMDNSRNVKQKNVETSLDKNENISLNVNSAQAKLVDTNSEVMNNSANVNQKNVETSLDKNENIAPNVNSAQAKSVDISSEVMNNFGNVKQKNVETSLDKNENISLNVNSAQAKSVDTNSEVMNNSGNVNQKNVETSLDKNENIAPNVNGAQAKPVDTSSEVINNFVELSTENKKKSSHKRHCCFFCKKNVYQIVRHWETVHSQEAEVEIIRGLHTSNPLRRHKIDSLRRKGDYTFNQSHLLNDKDYIVTRVSKCQDTEFVPCPSCLGYFSKKNLRHHKQKCSPNKGSRYLQGNSRKLTYHIHEKASDTLRNIITPDMFHDHVANQVFFDEVLVIYGNYLCIKYTEHHLKNHIRAQLRLLGRFMVQVKVHDDKIKECKGLIHSKNIDTVRKAIDDIAELDPLSNIYKHPTNARTLLTELKKLIQVLKSESDKAEDDVLMKRVKGFSRRVKQELAPYINRICKNSENKMRRLKQQERRELPENENIGRYIQCLYENISTAREQLAVNFSKSLWVKLTQNLMVYLAVFNRKRPGETQRIEMVDFHNRECVGRKDLVHLDESEKIQAEKYERIGFRGKLGNSTALLVDKVNIIPGINVILSHREAAGVDPSNRYLFAKPSKTEKNATFDAYRCHKQFCESMGMIHENLTFTKLRKHFATEVSKKGASQEDERRISTYMSHDFNIHKKIYDHSATLMDITKVSKHLEGTMKGREHNIEKNKDECRLKRKTSKTSLSENDEREKKFKRVKKLIYESDEDYEPITDTSSKDEEPSLEEVERCIGKFRKRQLWSSLEKQTTRNFFQEEIHGNKIIENSKVRKFKELYKEVMKNRPIPMVKQWIEKAKNKEKNRGSTDLRPRFSTPEREILERSTERHSLEGSEPSIQELEDLLLTHDVLRHRTANSLLRKFRHMQQKKTRTSSNNTSNNSHSASDNY